MTIFCLFCWQPWAVYTDGVGEAAVTMLLRDPDTRVHLLLFFITLGLELSDTKVYAP